MNQAGPPPSPWKCSELLTFPPRRDVPAPGRALTLYSCAGTAFILRHSCLPACFRVFTLVTSLARPRPDNDTSPASPPASRADDFPHSLAIVEHKTTSGKNLCTFTKKKGYNCDYCSVLNSLSVLLPTHRSRVVNTFYFMCLSIYIYSIITPIAQLYFPFQPIYTLFSILNKEMNKSFLRSISSTYIDIFCLATSQFFQETQRCTRPSHSLHIKLS